MNFENYENDFLEQNASYYMNDNKYGGNEILHSMQESLDNFLLNLKKKSKNNNLSKEELENYYLSNDGIYNSLNVDLISPYQTLVKQNIRRQNNNTRKNNSKRTYSAKSLINKVNTSVFNNNNNLKNNYSFYDKNLDNIMNNNSMFYNESDAMNAMKNKINFNTSI